MKSPRLYLTLKIYEKGKVVKTVQSFRKLSFIQKLKASSGEQYHLKVVYNKEHLNEGDYLSKSKLMEAYTAFTEADLIRSLQ